MTLELQCVPTSEIIPLRHLVLRPNQPLSACFYPGDEDSNTVHIAGKIGDQLVSIASWYLESHPQISESSPWRLRGMATHPEFLKRGYGRDVFYFGIETLKEQHGHFLWFNARVSAAEFYQKLGCQALSTGTFNIPGIGPHILMGRKI
ncbi:MAG: GNAT family N-acetyltransferase [Bdellovibrionales bacterium]|nr:GNAT family N-acetyltransferase [Bdellovibrionales bacterium]